ncbi:septal ring lytic transglycosylase RlpA family protein [Parabacteroides pacaensis]|uniref:septal ring lytic transglycosylase RlpA family protein n=1 Tax=Parabacteroides pacaensis TaxID=2086575 RepID=UPI001F28B40C|nr:septal ring lytic transglycosylase RlpA family protein [Parabacteroides pacaensis]
MPCILRYILCLVGMVGSFHIGFSQEARHIHKEGAVHQKKNSKGADNSKEKVKYKDNHVLEEGIASYYHAKFHGRKMSSGRVHDKSELVAAHRTLPFGTFVRVTNLANKKSVVVSIEDRGPFRRGWIIDISYQAAKSLDFVAKGITKVRLEVVPGPIDYSKCMECLYTETSRVYIEPVILSPPLKIPVNVVIPEVKKKKKFLGWLFG